MNRNSHVVLVRVSSEPAFCQSPNPLEGALKRLLKDPQYIHIETCICCDISIYTYIFCFTYIYVYICMMHIHACIHYVYIYMVPPPSYLPFLGEVKEVFRVQG